MISIAIDGPSGAGKSTLSARLAAALGFVYVDTGAMYRTIGLAAVQDGKDPKNEAQVTALLPSINISLKYQDGAQRIFLNDADVSDAIRQEAISMAASDVSAYPAVREFLLETQRGLAEKSNLIMDGRDIGTVVLPNATLKIFLTADVDDRAHRRYEQLVEKGMPADLKTIRTDVIERDKKDSERAIAPLRKADDAVEVNTTGYSFEKAYKTLLELIKKELQLET